MLLHFSSFFSRLPYVPLPKLLKNWRTELSVSAAGKTNRVPPLLTNLVNSSASPLEILGISFSTTTPHCFSWE